MAYDILLPSIPVLMGYILTYSLYKMDLIKKSFHVNIWHLIIVVAFLISGLAGFILLILLDMGISLPISGQLLYWHVESSVTLALVGVFHFHIYWKSTKAMFLGAKRRVEA